MTPTQAHATASKLYRLQRKAGAWSVLHWRPGLNCWELGNAILRRGDAVQERAGLVTAHALMLLGVRKERITQLLMTFYKGRARDRIADAYQVERGLP